MEELLSGTVDADNGGFSEENLLLPDGEGDRGGMVTGKGAMEGGSQETGKARTEGCHGRDMEGGA